MANREQLLEPFQSNVGTWVVAKTSGTGERFVREFDNRSKAEEFVDARRRNIVSINRRFPRIPEKSSE